MGPGMVIAITMLVAAMPLKRSIASCRVACLLNALCSITAVTTALSTGSAIFCKTRSEKSLLMTGVGANILFCPYG